MEYTDVDHYIRSFPEHIQAILIKLRQTVIENAPNATEDINGGMPAYQTKGKLLVSFSVSKAGTFIYFPPLRPADYTTEIAGPGHKNNFVVFKPGQPVKYDLVGQIIQYWYKEYNQKVMT
ncbi:MAG: DUF1801 domain-containing protein [Bacteroidales bacterium]